MPADPDRPEQLGAASGRSGPSPRLILLGATALLVAVFVLRNNEPTQLDFMVFEWDTTVRWSIFIAIVLGIVLDRLAMRYWRRRTERKGGG